MGYPKMQKKKYNKPKKPFDKDRIESEKKILKTFGLSRKHEIWRAESIIRNYRRRAREIQASSDTSAEKTLMNKLETMEMGCSNLDDVLSLNVENILSRRLQTIVYKKGLSNTIKHSRQMIVHGHIKVNNKKVKWPSYIVKKTDKIELVRPIGNKNNGVSE